MKHLGTFPGRRRGWSLNPKPQTLVSQDRSEDQYTQAAFCEFIGHLIKELQALGFRVYGLGFRA